jgi:hypothetical protein
VITLVTYFFNAEARLKYQRLVRGPQGPQRAKSRWLLSRRLVLKGGGALAGSALVAGCGNSSSSTDGGVDARPDRQGTAADMRANGGTDAGPMTSPSDAGAPEPDAGTAPADAAQPQADAAPQQDAPPAVETHPAPYTGPAWVRDARIGGCDASLDPPELAAALDAMASQGVSVIEFDSVLSFYLTDAQFEEEAQILDEAAKAAHARGMKAVIYIPTLEVMTPEVARAPGSMFRDHPDWVQVDIAGKPNRFVGGEGRVFWVEPGTESAWLCPSTPYAEYFFKRVQRLARTALDGMWGDVPLLSDIVAQWPCICSYCKARFNAETGMTIPAAVNWSSAAFRRWVTWRHKLISDFEQKILTKAREARADFEVIIETVTMDYTSGTAQGLDPASVDDGGLLRVWEVDAVSDRSAMRSATADDWMDMAVMMKYGAGISGHRPSWVFCYGIQPDDAEHVFGLALATGNNPFELKIPIMTETVSAAYRSRVFNWLKGEEALYAAYPLHHVAVLYSSASRDFLDQVSGVGLYSSLNAGDNLWWSTTSSDTVPQMQYVADYRGWCRALIHAHVPFDVLPTARATAAALGRYRVVVVPSAVALSDATMAQLAMFVAAGGTVIASGPDLGKFDENGADRGSAALLTGLGITPGGAWMRKPSGSGFVAAGAERAGRTYLRKENQQAAMQIAASVTQPQLVTDAPAAVVFGVRRTRDGKMLLVAANLDGLGASAGSFTPRPASFKVALSLEGKQATAVSGSQPGAGKAPISFENRDGRVHFSLGVAAVSVVTINLG